jgi:type II secretory pathway component GspD/PulD (secretin)
MIEIEAQVLEIASSQFNKTGSDLEKFKTDLQLYLQAQVSSGSADLLARPRISALSGEEASIQIGDKIPYAVPAGGTSDKWTINYLDTGVKLRIIAEVEDNFVIASIISEVSSISQWQSNSAGNFPVISTRESRTKVKVRDKEPIIIGGLLNEQERDIVNAIPFFKDLPFIGPLFTTTQKEKIKTDIVFIIIPRIIF